MNYLPFIGWGFYGAANSTARANFFASWGLMADLPAAEPPTFIKRLTDWFWEFF